MANDDELLKILLAKISSVRADNVEKLADNCCDACKMAGARLTFHLVAKCRHVHHGLHRARIHIRHRRCKKEIHICMAQQICVTFEITRILVEIFIGAELQRIDENRNDRDVIFRT
ncbi:hypothetical protein D3C80_1092270 [compost metagenome]